jgi:hypothetical protein
LRQVGDDVYCVECAIFLSESAAEGGGALAEFGVQQLRQRDGK